MAWRESVLVDISDPVMKSEGDGILSVWVPNDNGKGGIREEFQGYVSINTSGMWSCGNGRYYSNPEPAMYDLCLRIKSIEDVDKIISDENKLVANRAKRERRMALYAKRGWME